MLENASYQCRRAAPRCPIPFPSVGTFPPPPHHYTKIQRGRHLLGGVATLPSSDGCIGKGVGMGLGVPGIGTISWPTGTRVDRGRASMM